jgi:hypothetical protein
MSLMGRGLPSDCVRTITAVPQIAAPKSAESAQ